MKTFQRNGARKTRKRAVPPGMRLRLARLEKGLTIDAAAEGAGVSKSTWQGWEEGRDPGASSAVRAADLLATTVEALWGKAAPTPADVRTPVAAPTSDAPTPNTITVVRDAEYDQTGAES